MLFQQTTRSDMILFKKYKKALAIRFEIKTNENWKLLTDAWFLCRSKKILDLTKILYVSIFFSSNKMDWSQFILDPSKIFLGQ